MELRKGTVFDTEFETGCTVTVAPEDMLPEDRSRFYTYFFALDPEGVECEYSTIMVVGHPDHLSVK